MALEFELRDGECTYAVERLIAVCTGDEIAKVSSAGESTHCCIARAPRQSLEALSRC